MHFPLQKLQVKIQSDKIFQATVEKVQTTHKWNLIVLINTS